MPLDGGRLHVADVRLEQLGVVRRESRVADQLREVDAVRGVVDTLPLRVIEEDVVDPPRQQSQLSTLRPDGNRFVRFRDGLFVWTRRNGCGSGSLLSTVRRCLIVWILLHQGDFGN